MPEPLTLNPSLSLAITTFSGLGTILGAGSYALVGEVAAPAGIHAPPAFGVAAVIAAFTACSYVPLSSRYPKGGGEAAYVHRAFSRPWLSAVSSC